MAPIVYDNTVYISTVPGNAQGFYVGGGRGIFYALDVHSGAIRWSWDTTTDNLWGNVKVNSGGGLWYPPSVDDSGNLYFGTGNAAPWPGNEDFPSGSSRPGDNNYASSMVSLDPKTGSLRWYINAKPHDLFDLDFQNTPVLASVLVNGADTTVVFGSGKTGTIIAAVAESGEQLWMAAVGKHQNDDLQEIPAGENVEVYPGSGGGIQTPIAYANGIVFAVSHNNPRFTRQRRLPHPTTIPSLPPAWSHFMPKMVRPSGRLRFPHSGRPRSPWPTMWSSLEASMATSARTTRRRVQIFSGRLTRGSD